MTLQAGRREVGVRELHDRLSKHLQRVAAGADVIVTRRGQPIALLTAIGSGDPLAELSRRGLVTAPTRARDAKRPTIRPGRPVSDLVAEQRR